MNKKTGGKHMKSNIRYSILGDSISTYVGVSNNPETNPTIGMNPAFYRPPFPKEKTYWNLVAREIGLTLCVNNSWSGGNLSGELDPSSGVNRAGELTDADGNSPDLVIVFMGINDLGRRVDPNVFSEDYVKALTTIKSNHPDAKVCCVNIPDRDPILKTGAALFNSLIASAVDMHGDNFFVADLFSSRLNNDFYYMNTLDGLHPDEDGMKIIAEVVAEAIKENM